MATQKEIFAVADAIVAEGGNPQLATVRERLGGGSYSTIGPALKAWRSQQPKKTAKSTAPPPVPDTVTGHMRALWDEALRLAKAEYEADRERLAIERQEIERERQEVGELADQLAGELDEARAQLLRLEGADRRLEAAKAEAAQALDVANKQLESASAKLNQALGRADALDRENRAQAMELEHLRQANAALLDERGVLAGELKATTKRAEKAEKEAEQHRKEGERARVSEQAAQARLELVGREMQTPKRKSKTGD